MDLVRRLGEDLAEHGAAALTEVLEDELVVVEERFGGPGGQARPVAALGDEGCLGGFAAKLGGALGALVGHLQEEEVRELLDVVESRDAGVAEQLAVRPEAVDEGGGRDRGGLLVGTHGGAHRGSSSWPEEAGLLVVLRGVRLRTGLTAA